MPVYLEYLLNRYASAGGSVEYATVPSLASVDAPVVVNCTGIGARSLVPDESVVPVRGQIVVVENPGISEFYIDHGAEGTPDYVYAFPHGDVVDPRRDGRGGGVRLGAAAGGLGADPAGLRGRLPRPARARGW